MDFWAEFENPDVESTRQLLERVLKTLASLPEAVRVRTLTLGEATTFTVRVAAADVAKLIGEDDRTLRALRMILGSIGLRRHHQFSLEIEMDVADDPSTPALQER